jgi:hypothetical protein
MVTVRDGLIVDNRAYMNGTEMSRQLGVMPPRGSGRERAMLEGINLTTRLSRVMRRE